MDLLLVRHGRAEERAAFALKSGDDSERPLTEEGLERMRKGVKGLRQVLPQLDVLASSPLLRARQTAAVLADAYGVPVRSVDALAPGQSPARLLPWLKERGRHQVVAVVGHEPDLGLLAGWLLTGGEHSFLPLKKGAVCLLHFPAAVAAGTAELQWVLTSSQLRMIARAR